MAVQYMHYAFVDVISPHVARRSLPDGLALIVKEPNGPSGHPLCVIRSLDKSAVIKWLTDNEYELDVHPIKKRFYGIDGAGDIIATRPRPRARKG